MRLWSIHPKYLDPAGLTACWREGLLARVVLCGRIQILLRLVGSEMCIRDSRLTVSCGQLDYEFEHLKRKLELRSPKNYMRLIAVRSIEPHPLFRVTTGGVAVWEIIR